MRPAAFAAVLLISPSRHFTPQTLNDTAVTAVAASTRGGANEIAPNAEVRAVTAAITRLSQIAVARGARRNGRWIMGVPHVGIAGTCRCRDRKNITESYAIA